jgi:hypothetical protein
MMHLRADLEERLKQQLDELEESLEMPYVTSVERIAKTEGRTEGRTEGGATVLLKQLTKRWGLLSDETQQQIRRLQFEQQAALGEALLDFHTVKDLQDWLVQQTDEPGN